MANILVTGGAGFIGSRLSEKLIDADHTVICLDNFFTGQRKNVEYLLDHPNFTLLEHDIIDPLWLDKLPEVTNNRVDQIYNLACPASPVHYQFNRVQASQGSRP